MNQIGDFSGRVRAAAEWSGFLPRAYSSLTHKTVAPIKT
jgi:hypothetical protein